MPSTAITRLAAPRYRAAFAAVASAAVLLAAVYVCDSLLYATAAPSAGRRAEMLPDNLFRLGGIVISLLAAGWVYRMVSRRQTHAGRRDGAARRKLRGAAPDASANALLITDNNACIIWSNHAFSDLTGYSFEETLGHHCSSLLKTGPHDREFYENLWRTLGAGLAWHGEIINRRKDGSLFHDELTITPLPGDDGRFDHAVAFQRERSARRQTGAQPVYADPLARMADRDLVLERLERALQSCARNGRRAALMLVDLEHCRQPDGGHDRSADDRFRAETARRMAACLRAGDTTIGYGDNEFAVLLALDGGEDESYPEAMQIAAKIRAAVMADDCPPAELPIEPCRSCCIGIAVFDRHAASAEALLKHAAAAMCQARSVGGNSIRFYRQTAPATVPAH